MDLDGNNDAKLYIYIYSMSLRKRDSEYNLQWNKVSL